MAQAKCKKPIARFLEKINKLTLFWKTLKRYPRFLYILRKNANFIIYIRNKTPEQIANEIVTLVKS